MQKVTTYNIEVDSDGDTERHYAESRQQAIMIIRGLLNRTHEAGTSIVINIDERMAL